MPISSSLSLKSSGSSTGSITGFVKQLFSRNAVIYKPNIFGHEFETVILKQPTYCSQCRNLIYGVFGQRCRLCKLSSHKICLNSIGSKCVHTKGGSAMVSGDVHEDGHKFEWIYFKSPHYCNHCGQLLAGILSRQGLKCDQTKGGCGMNVHDDCKDLVSLKCGKKDPKKVMRTNEAGEPNTSETWSKIRIEDFQLVRLLGTGFFSKVYLARFGPTHEEFAIKVIKKTDLVIRSNSDSAFTERMALNLGRQYPFLTFAHCCFQSRDRIFFVMEHVVGQNLFYHLTKARKFTEDRTRFYAAEIVLALIFLHKQRVVYRDLKLDNVILDKHGHCKLLDFGVSKELAADKKTRTFCGTPNYIAPEIIKELDYGFSVDWWALGVIIFEMLAGHSPFGAQDEEELYKAIIEEEVQIPRFLSNEASCILDGLLTKDPLIRLGCHILDDYENAVLEHPFFMFRAADDNSLSHQWNSIKEQRMKPPYRPTDDDLRSMDGECSQELSMSPVDFEEARKIPQNEFSGFSFYSDSFDSRLN